jgi:hypothetical protein
VHGGCLFVSLLVMFSNFQYVKPIHTAVISFISAKSLRNLYSVCVMTEGSCDLCVTVTVHCGFCGR